MEKNTTSFYKKHKDKIKLFLLSFILFIAIVVTYILWTSRNMQPTYGELIIHQNAAETLRTTLDSYYAEEREYPIIKDWQDSLGSCLSDTPCLNSYIPEEGFDAGSKTTFYYWLSDDQQNVVICVYTKYDTPKDGNDYYCTGNGIAHSEVPGDIDMRTLDEEVFPLNGNWTLVQNWQGEEGFETPKNDDLSLENIDEEEREIEIFTVNRTASSSTDSDTYGYQTFQLKFPSKYLVTSDDMRTPYNTQGGMAEPVLIFTLDEQPLGKNFPDDYIALHSTKGFTKVEDWEQLFYSELDYEILSENTAETENYSVYKRVLSYENGDNDVYQAFIFLPEEVSYFFETKGNIPEEDFDSIVESLKVRAFIDWE